MISYSDRFANMKVLKTQNHYKIYKLSFKSSQFKKKGFKIDKMQI